MGMGDGNGNGNGNGGSHDQELNLTPLEAVLSRIGDEEPRGNSSEYPASIEEDVVHRWKAPHGPVALEDVHAGLISVSQIAEAAIEGGVKLSSDLRHVLLVLQEVSSQLSRTAVDVQAVRKDVQYLKDEVREIKGQADQIPALKGLLYQALSNQKG